MKAYFEIIETFGSSRLRACASGEAGVPLPAYKAPSEWYGFPPALIPIWSDGSGPSYLGIWKHWFSTREFTFVKQYVGLGHKTVEIARTEERFFAYLAIQSITLEDGVGESLRKFAENVGLSNLEEIDQATVESGDDPRCFTSLPIFALKTPLESSVTDAYNGTFPTNLTSLEHASLFEVKADFFFEWKAIA